jgi:hypothetical protein
MSTIFWLGSLNTRDHSEVHGLVSFIVYIMTFFSTSDYVSSNKILIDEL